VWLYNSPPGPTIGFVPDEYTFSETQGTGVLTVQLIDGVLERDVEVTVATNPGSATEDGKSAHKYNYYCEIYHLFSSWQMYNYRTACVSV